MESFMAGLGILLIYLTWRFALKKSVLDDHRDKLFDLRDGLRETFVERGWSLDSPVYRQLRDLINNYLRFTDQFSFVEFMATEAMVSKRPDLIQNVRHRVATQFEGVPKDQQLFIKKFRRQAVEVMMSYMIVSFGPLVILTAFLLPIAAVVMAVQFFCSALKAGGTSVFMKAVQVQEVIMALINYTIAFVAVRILEVDFVEYSSQTQR